MEAELSRFLGQIMGSRPASPRERATVADAALRVNTWAQLPPDVRQLVMDIDRRTGPVTASLVHAFACAGSECPDGCSTATRKPRVIKNPKFEELHHRGPGGRFADEDGIPAVPKKAARPAKMTPEKARERLDNAEKMFGSDRSKWAPAQRRAAEKLDLAAKGEQGPVKAARKAAPKKAAKSARKTLEDAKADLPGMRDEQAIRDYLSKMTLADMKAFLKHLDPGMPVSGQTKDRLSGNIAAYLITGGPKAVLADSIGGRLRAAADETEAKDIINSLKLMSKADWEFTADRLNVPRANGDSMAALKQKILTKFMQDRQPQPLSPQRIAAIDEELEANAAAISNLEQYAKPRVDLLAKIDKKKLGPGLTFEDARAYEKAESELRYNTEEGLRIANAQLDLLGERDRPPWGGTLPLLPGAAPVTAGINTQAVQDARDEYVIDDPRTIRMNKSLRSGKPGSEAKKWAERMQNMVDSQTITNDSTVFRSAALSPEMIVQMKPGTILRDKGFISTDEDRDRPTFYGDHRALRAPGKIPVMFNIKVPAGTKGFDAQYGEFVFGPGTPIRVAHISRTPAGGVEVIAEILPEGKA